MSRYEELMKNYAICKKIWEQNCLHKYEYVIVVSSLELWNICDVILRSTKRDKYVILTDRNIDGEKVVYVNAAEMEAVISLYRCFQFAENLIICDAAALKEYQRLFHYVGLHNLDESQIIKETILRDL